MEAAIQRHGMDAELAERVALAMTELKTPAAAAADNRVTRAKVAMGAVGLLLFGICRLKP